MSRGDLVFHDPGKCVPHGSFERILTRGPMLVVEVDWSLLHPNDPDHCRIKILLASGKITSWWPDYPFVLVRETTLRGEKEQVGPQLP